MYDEKLGGETANQGRLLYTISAETEYNSNSVECILVDDLQTGLE